MNTLTLMTVANRLNAAKPIEFDGIRILGLWEKLNTPWFNTVEFDGIRTKANQMRTLLADPNLKCLKA